MAAAGPGSGARRGSGAGAGTGITQRADADDPGDALESGFELAAYAGYDASFDRPFAPQRAGTRHLATINLLLEHLTDAVILFDEQGRVVDQNDAVSTLFGSEVPFGANSADLARRVRLLSLDGEHVDPDHLPSRRALAGETVRNVDLAFTRSDGEHGYLAASASPIIVRDEIRGALLVLSDITARMRREAEATTLATLAQHLTRAELDLHTIARTIVRRLADATGARDMRLLLVDTRARVLRQIAHVGATPALQVGRDGVNTTALDLYGDSLEALAARTRLPAYVTDLRAIPHLEHERATDRLPNLSAQRPTAASGSAIAVPLLYHNDLIAILSYELPQAHTFDTDEMTFLTTVASHAAIAINNALVFQQRTQERAFLANLIEYLPAALLVFDVLPPSNPRMERNQRLEYRVSSMNARAASFVPVGLLERVAGRRQGIVGLRLRRIATDPESLRLLDLLDAASNSAHLQNVEVTRTSGTQRSHWNVALVPVRTNVDGTAAELMLLATDITEQVSARQRIEELVHVAGDRAAELEAMVSAMTDAVTVSDADGNLRLANSAALAMYGHADLTSLQRVQNIPARVLLRTTDGIEITPEAHPLARALRGETLEADYSMYHHGYGRDVHRRTNAAPVRNPAGEIVGAVAVETDITSLVEIDRLKDAFFSTAAHELRTPLTAIKGYVQILARQLANPTPAAPVIARSLSTLREQTDRMERLINDLLDMARVETGQLELRPREFDLVELLREQVSDAARSTTLHKITLREDQPEIIGRWDRDRLAQVFANLLTNAIKYSPDGGPISVRAGRSGSDTAWITVSDRGIGIEQELLPTIFMRYARAHDSQRYHQSGLGIGLYITREIVDAHGGEISVKSVPGQGTIFSVRLPLQTPRPRSLLRPDVPPKQPPGTHSS